jgi:hypothetical protein
MDHKLKPAKSDARDGMRIDWDTPIPMDDGIVLRGVRCSLPRRNSILPLSIHTICSFAWLCGSTWTPAAMLHHTSIPWSPERMRRLIFSLICSSAKAANGQTRGFFSGYLR